MEGCMISADVIQGFSPVESISCQAIAPVPAGTSSASSIKQAEVNVLSNFAQPQLAPPRHYMLGLLDMHNQIERVVSKEAVAFKAQLQVDRAELERLEQEKEAAFKEHAKEIASKNSWSAWASV